MSAGSAESANDVGPFEGSQDSEELPIPMLSISTIGLDIAETVFHRMA
jgi:hypothetical protein